MTLELATSENRTALRNRETAQRGRQMSDRQRPFSRCVDQLMARLGEREQFVPLTRERILSSW